MSSHIIAQFKLSNVKKFGKFGKLIRTGLSVVLKIIVLFK